MTTEEPEEVIIKKKIVLIGTISELLCSLGFLMVTSGRNIQLCIVTFGYSCRYRAHTCRLQLIKTTYIHV